MQGDVVIQKSLTANWISFCLLQDLEKLENSGRLKGSDDREKLVYQITEEV